MSMMRATLRSVSVLAVFAVMVIGCASASGAWTAMSISPPTGAKESNLYGISCANGEVCWAVGDYHNASNEQEALALSVYNGVQLPPNPGEKAQLIGVSCPQETTEEFCMAVGRFYNSHGTLEAFAEKHTRTTGWQLQTLTFPAGSTASELGSVSCPTIKECMAVGDYHDSKTGMHYLAEHWSGSTWAPEAPTEPAGAEWGWLATVSCPEAKHCIAIGNYRESPYNPNNQVTETAKYEGSWTVPSIPMSQTGTLPDIASDTCVTMAKCVSAGWSSVASVNEIQIQNRIGTGSGWTQSATPSGAGELQGVSCWESVTSCISVGQHIVAGSLSALGERLETGVWEEFVLPAISGASANWLDRVSCLKAEICYAAGSYIIGGKNHLLVERSF
jgi:hypothetical protein